MDACDHLASFVADCDRKTEQSKKKLADTQEALSEEVGTRCHQAYYLVQVTAKANTVHDLAEQIGKKLAAAEAMGGEGKVSLHQLKVIKI